LRQTLREKYAHLTFPASGHGTESDAEEEFLRQVLQTIRQNLSAPAFGVPELCQALGISRTQCYRKLDALTGRSAGELIRYYRIEKAKQLLASTNLNIAQAAFECGFKDHAYFTRAFKREAGLSPSSFRKKNS
ncbi:MAG: helix-turn-helix transcriptional regulator, partial [Phaeodactylibacter sp.]|nr:helix-turn-helix transcriptional regulator [Phaeodactylibacter sp.]